MPPRILLIEDNDLNRYLVTFLMEKHGFQVVAAPDGPAGIADGKHEVGTVDAGDSGMAGAPSQPNERHAVGGGQEGGVEDYRTTVFFRPGNRR